MEYRIVEECDKYNCAERVQELMKDGWQPLGGVSVTAGENDYGYDVFYYIQALTRGESR